MLRAYGFTKEVVDLVDRLFANNWFSILFNGEASDFLISSWGFRQVEPLSPVLFLVVAKFLGRGLNHLLSSNSRRCFVFLGGGSFIPYLAFADDIIIFMTFKRVFRSFTRIFVVLLVNVWAKGECDEKLFHLF